MKAITRCSQIALRRPTGRRERIRVLHVISGRMFGGGQRVVQDLLRTLPTVADLDVRLCLLGQKGDFFAEFKPLVVKYRGSYRNPLTAWRTARGLRRVLRATAPDILHTHGFDAELIGALAVAPLPIRHISHVHDTPGWIASRRLKHRVRRALTRLLLRRARTSCIACSEATRQYVCTHLGWPPDAVRTVRNGIDLERFSAKRPSPAEEPDDGLPFVIGTVARLTRGKGIEHLLQTAGLLAAEGVRFELRIAGDGPSAAEYRQFAVDLGIAPRVHFLGFVQDTPEFYRRLDVFVLVSEREGLPLTVLEAMAMGLPVVATPVMGTAEVIRDGVDGFLVPPKDVEGLRVALTRLAQCPKLRLTVGKNARERIQAAFGLERVAREIVESYAHTLCFR